MDTIERVAHEVYNLLRSGMSEEIYHDVLCVGLRHKGMRCEQEYILPITIYGEQTKRFIKPDIIVDGKIIVELKACGKLTDTHRCQVERYLNVSKLREAILINFGPMIYIQKCTRDDTTFTWVPSHITNL